MSYAKNLKSSQLRLIVKIVDTGQLQVAADALAISQPAASRMLSEIEKALGTKLFDRHPKGMVLTSAGSAFVRHARSIIEAYDNLGAEINSVKKGTRGEVRIGAVTGAALRTLIPTILKLKKDFRELEFTVDVSPSYELVKGLSERRYDFILARLPKEYDSRTFKIVPARGEEVALVVRASHPLAYRQNINLDELLEYEWAIQERGSPIREAVESTFISNGLSVPHNVTNTSSLLVVLGLLEQSDVIGSFSEEVASLITSDKIGSKLITLNIAEQMKVSPYFLITNRDVELSKASQNVIREVLNRL